MKLNELSPEQLLQKLPNNPAALFFDTSSPNSARIFDYLLGGMANFEVDRAAAEKLIQLWPALPKVIRLRRAFIQEAGQILYEQGFRQFLDLASGLPTADHLHAILPDDTRIVYSDINPVAISYGESYLAHLEHVAYIFGNAAQVEQILAHPTVEKLFTLEEKVAIGINAITIFLPQQIILEMAQKLAAWAPPGSTIFVAFQSRLTTTITADYLQVINLFANAGMPIWLYTTQEINDMLSPWQINSIEPLVRFLGLPDDFIKQEELALLDMELNAAFLTLS